MKNIFTFLLFLTLFLTQSLFSVEIDKLKFIELTEVNILESVKSKSLLFDASDVYTYYFLTGKIHGMVEAQNILEECEIRLP